MPGPRPDDGDPVTTALNAIFSDYLDKCKGMPKGFDRDTRDPAIILDTAADLGLIPARDRTLTVTGSKGKGTVSRAAGQALIGLPTQAADAFGRFHDSPGPGRDHTGGVGLIVSPNEVTQTDRLRIDGQPIGRDDFLDAFDRVKPALDRLRGDLQPPHYLSPFGAFLLIGLAWFCKRGVDWVVLEGGRGAAWDEVGRLPARISVITTIIMEHPAQLGPTLNDIARDKLTIADGKDACLLGPGLVDELPTLGIPVPANAVAFDTAWLDERDAELPRWLAIDRALGRRAAALLAATADPEIATRSLPSHSAGSFGMIRLALTTGDRSIDVVYDATGHPKALDTEWYGRKRADWRNPVALCCLSDQKDPDGMVALLAEIGIPVIFVTLADAAMHRFDRVAAQWPGAIVDLVDYDDDRRLAAVIDRIALSGGHDAVLCLGIQPFIRLIRRLPDTTA